MEHLITKFVEWNKFIYPIIYIVACLITSYKVKYKISRKYYNILVLIYLLIIFFWRNFFEFLSVSGLDKINMEIISIVLSILILSSKAIFIVMRLNDIKRSPWLSMAILVPLYNFYLYLSLIFTETKGGFKYYTFR